MSGKLTVGVFIHHLDNDYSKAFLKGTAAAANDLDVNLAIFPGLRLTASLLTGDIRFMNIRTMSYIALLQASLWTH